MSAQEAHQQQDQAASQGGSGNGSGQGPNGGGQQAAGGQGGNGGQGQPETFSREYVEQLRRESAGHRTEAAALKQKVSELEGQGMTELEKATTRVTELTSENTRLSDLVQRYEVAAAKGLPLSMAGRLQGSSKTELEQDADKLKQEFGIQDAAGQGQGGSGNGSGTSFNGGVRGGNGGGQGDDVSMSSLIRQAAGRTQ